AERRNGWATLLALTGLTGIAAAMALLTKRSPFPGVATLLPCIGAGLVIAAGELGKSPVLRLLGNPAARFVGRISYSLYLIHWPVYVFAGLWFAGHGAWFIHESPAFRVGGPLAAVVLAAVLYRFVEQPPRRNRRLFTRTVVFTMSGLALLLVIAGAAVTIRAKGWPERYSGRMQTLLAQKESPNPIEHVRWGTCFFAWADYRIDLSSETCFPKGRRTVLLWGDSTMAHFYFGLEPLFRTIGYQTAETTVGACAPIPGDAETPAPDGCRALQRQILDLTLERRPELVILGAYWDLTPERTRELLDLVARLRANGSAVLVLGNSRRLVARGPFIVISRITGDLALPDDARLVYSQPELDAADAALKHALNERFAGDSGVMFIEPARLFFTDNLRIAGGDEPYFIDFVHFSRAGSAYYGKLLFDELMTMWTPEDKPPLPPGESAGSTPPAPP
ncbi:MAG: acyltransferase, partial [Methylobacteriaceae bacterium]|nr:acyltransferase [Methylobacteriaceae bacterium]